VQLPDVLLDDMPVYCLPKWQGLSIFAIISNNIPKIATVALTISVVSHMQIRVEKFEKTKFIVYGKF
jgi:hypothetical protein